MSLILSICAVILSLGAIYKFENKEDLKEKEKYLMELIESRLRNEIRGLVETRFGSYIITDFNTRINREVKVALNGLKYNLDTINMTYSRSTMLERRLMEIDKKIDILNSLNPSAARLYKNMVDTIEEGLLLQAGAPLERKNDENI